MHNIISNTIQSSMVLALMARSASSMPMSSSNAVVASIEEPPTVNGTIIKSAMTLDSASTEIVSVHVKPSLNLAAATTSILPRDFTAPLNMPELFTGSLASPALSTPPTPTFPTSTKTAIEAVQTPSTTATGKETNKDSKRSVMIEGEPIVPNNLVSSNITERWNEPMYCAYRKKPLGFNRIWSVMVPNVPDAEGVCRGLWDNLKSFAACWNPHHCACDVTDDGQGLYWRFLALESCNSGMMESVWWEATKNEFGPIECHPYHWPGWEGRVEELEDGYDGNIHVGE